jgi:hypothetical protein
VDCSIPLDHLLAAAFTIPNDDERRALGDARSFAAGGLREFVLRSQSAVSCEAESGSTRSSHARQSSVVVHGRSRLSGAAAV